mmetsp:Transcript_525/g.1158  ORF Transcript_525/g.1158 Transcript_525/m.1158 type:complete len:264 (+) Transcript_525:1946-2737(+)
MFTFPSPSSNSAGALSLLFKARKDLLPFERLCPSCLSGSDACHTDTEGGARDVVEPQGVAELHGLPVASVLSANAALDVSPCLLASRHSHFDQLPHARLVQSLEGLESKDLHSASVCRVHTLDVQWEEGTRVVPGHPEGTLCEVVGSEGEELGVLRQGVSHKSCSGQFDHGAEGVGEFESRLSSDLSSNFLDAEFLVVELSLVRHERDHDLGLDLLADLLRDLHRRPEDGTALHLGQVGVDNPQAAPSVAHHGVCFCDRVSDL